MYKYYCLMRPPMPGGVPKDTVEAWDYGDRILVPENGKLVWGHILSRRKLSTGEVLEYELMESTEDKPGGIIQ